MGPSRRTCRIPHRSSVSNFEFRVSNFEQTNLPTENTIFQWTRQKICGDKRSVLCD